MSKSTKKQPAAGRRRGWVTTRSRDGSRLAMRTEEGPRRPPVRLWTWAAVWRSGTFPYLRVSPASSREAAAARARVLNAGISRDLCVVRRVVYELHLPGDASATPGLPICRRASALGRL